MTHDQGEAGVPDWSPDGAAIAYQGHPGGDCICARVYNIFVLDPATGETSQVTYEKPKSTGALGPQFSPDGASIVYNVNRVRPPDDHLGWGVRIVPVTGGRSTLLVGGGRRDLEAGGGTLSPDGSTLAMWCRGPLEGICIANADGTNLRALVSDPGLLLGPRWSPDGTRIAYYNDVTEEVFVVDVATGKNTTWTDVATGAGTAWTRGTSPEWLDDHTLIVEIS